MNIGNEITVFSNIYQESIGDFMYKAENIAKYIIAKCNNDKKHISNLKLQKILYYIQAEFLIVKNITCFSEPIEAWSLGVIIPDVYNTYKIYGGLNISSRNGWINQNIRMEDRQIIDDVINECSKYTDRELLKIIQHQSTWIEAYNSLINNVIATESIKKYFQEK